MMIHLGLLIILVAGIDVSYQETVGCRTRYDAVKKELQSQLTPDSNSYTDKLLDNWTQDLIVVLETFHGSCDQFDVAHFLSSISGKVGNLESGKQIMGMFALERNPHLPLCAICSSVSAKIKRFLDIKKKYFNNIILDEVIGDLPNAEQLCYRILPSCSDEFPSLSGNQERSKRNIAELGECVECDLCKTVMLVGQIALFNNPTIINDIQKDVNNDLCYRLDNTTLPGTDTTLGDLCRQFGDDIIEGAFRSLSVFLDPVNFCTTEIKVCNGTFATNVEGCFKEACPSTMECLKELCRLILPANLSDGCSIIPSSFFTTLFTLKTDV